MLVIISKLAAIEGITAAALFALLAGCAAGARTDVKAAPPSEISRTTCQHYHPRDNAACRQFRLPDRAAEIAYRTCLAYDQIDQQRCDNLRHTYEAELHAYLKATQSAANRSPATAEEPLPPQTSRRELQRLHQTAQELYDAISKDAQTFAAAQLIPEVRQRVERALHRQLSDDVLQKLALHAQAEALYWYEYMQGLEKIEERTNPTTLGNLRPGR